MHPLPRWGIEVVVGRCENFSSLIISFQLLVAGGPLRQLHNAGTSLLGCLDCMQPELLLLQGGVSELGNVHF